MPNAARVSLVQAEPSGRPSHRAAGADEETGSAFEETAALGATDDPEGGSIQRDGA